MKLQMQKTVQNKAVAGIGKLLVAFAIIFASAPCSGHLHESEVPKSLRK